MAPKTNLNTSCQSALVLGLDTGGTYTDGVLLEYDSHKVLSTHKSLTTKRDLSLGIEAVIQGIDIEDPSAIQMVSISTTLATNAIAEGKSKSVALLLIGYDPELIASFKMETRFATEHYYYFSGGHDLHGQEKEQLDLTAILEKIMEIKDQVDAIAVSSYFSPLNPEHEHRCIKAISSICDLPVVLGHQLSTKLGSVERATTAALNASLLAVLKEFIVAVRLAMERRKIIAPLMVVRGDGTLMSDEFAALTPVETIHSGPAASAIGGRFLSGLDEALVIDIGGTTTDFAMIEQGQVAVSESGATVSGYKTAVTAADLFSIALGGDSHIRLVRDHMIRIGPERVVPIAYLADQYPEIVQRLQVLTQRKGSRINPEELEYWFLLRKPKGDSSPKTEQEKALLDILSKGPRSLPEILDQLGLFSRIQIETGHLDRHEIIGISALTPTDLLHVDGLFNAWNTTAADLALNVLSRCKRCEPKTISGQVYSMITEAIIHAIVGFTTGLNIPIPSKIEKVTDIEQWFLLNSLRNLHPHLETHFVLRCPIIGIGAPAKFFLEKVAAILNTDLVLPDHHQVANAVGAVSGSIMVTEEIIVYPQLAKDGVETIGYYVQTKEERLLYDESEEAITKARELSSEKAFGAALRSNAENPQVHVELHNDGLDTYRIRATAMGNPRLSHSD